ncbi:NrtR DNA-binding winged helix domain-containing protein [Lacticaseibacillus paracasei]|uniref:NrtR DNA-binding winged helix domain-containing protein n=1 Tax=Lacticaseibacillus paracasei TaxID=1597 RepID=UPI0031E6B7CD
MADEFLAHPLITITNVIWSFSPTTHQLQVLLIHRAGAPFAGFWALPETTLRERESADTAAIRLIRDKIGIHVNRGSTEQLATFTDPTRTPGERALALTYMTYLPTMPKLQPGYGATDARWFAFSAADEAGYQLQNGRTIFPLGTSTSELAFDHARILTVAIRRIRNRLDYQPTILQVLGTTFTLKEAREVYAPFLMTTANAIDNSNFKKTHQQLFIEVGTAHDRTRSGRPPKLFKLAKLKNPM